ncbi:hypothetical protein BD410DRAFT_833182 [Rickenella mellea]|uniref:F-box domain-containing protein n=1 Tax=Rickenella mellea TaxID=50990 RepID=A0A4Y7PFS2_9AGAM|nr:hypothetical protein BD410DRAFT_833182 [Rickenella mellea]
MSVFQHIDAHAAKIKSLTQRLDIVESVCGSPNPALNTSQISHHTLEVINAGLTRVKESDGHVEINTWLSHWSSESTSIVSSDKRHGLAELEDVCVALQSLLDTASCGVVVLELEQSLKKHSRNPTTILSLPDEKLVEIFEWNNTYDGEGNNCSIDISHVNKRFRRVALQCPRLWSVMHNGQNADELHTFLARSGVTELVVSLNEGLLKDSYIVFKPRVDEFLRVVSKHTQRWREFRCAIDNDVGDETTEVLHRYELLDCPTLQNIIFMNRMTNRPPVMLSCSSWVMPLLVEFKGQNAIPLSKVVTTLVQMDLELAAGGGWSIGDLRTALDHATALESLFIRFSASLTSTFTATPSEAYLQFPNLKKLEFHISDGSDTAEEFIGSVMGHFDAPLATSLKLMCSTYGALDGLLHAIIPNDGVFPALNTFWFLMESRRPFEHDTLPIVLARLPSLQHLHLGSDSFLNCGEAPHGIDLRSWSYMDVLDSRRDI